MTTQELVKALEDTRFNKSAERAKELAYNLSKVVISKMQSLNMTHVKLSETAYSIEYKEANSGYSVVALEDDKTGGWIGQERDYLSGDINCWIPGAKRKTNIRFLQNFRELVEVLAKEQERLISVAEKAIKDAEEVERELNSK